MDSLVNGSGDAVKPLGGFSGYSRFHFVAVISLTCVPHVRRGTQCIFTDVSVMDISLRTALSGGAGLPKSPEVWGTRVGTAQRWRPQGHPPEPSELGRISPAGHGKLVPGL